LFWLRVCPEIKNRGTRDVLMVVCDGLKGLPDAVNSVWEKTIVQTWRVIQAAALLCEVYFPLQSVATIRMTCS
jgi:transposase-like protein